MRGIVATLRRVASLVLALILITSAASGFVGASATTAAAVSLPAAGRPSAVGDVEAFGSSINQPDAISAGSDGNVWFGNRSSIGRITPSGALSRFDAAGINQPGDMVLGPDANVWFTNTWPAPAIGRITPSGTVTLFTHPDISPLGITVGPDGALWFTTSRSWVCNPTCHFTLSGIGRITTDGVITVFQISATDSLLLRLTAGPDGRLWVTRSHTSPSGSDAILAVTTAGVVSTYRNEALSSPVDVTLGADGNVWFTSSGGLGRVTPAGTFTFSDPTVVANGAILTGPGGDLWFTGTHTVGRVAASGAITTSAAPGAARSLAATSGDLWFADRSGDAVNRMTVDGTITTFGAPPIKTPSATAVADDGTVWFTNADDDSIGKLTPAGDAVAIRGPGINGPTGITLGADGNLWFANHGNSTIGRVTPDGVVSFFSDPSIDRPYSLTSGPDGNIWFTNTGASSIGRITPAGAVTSFTGTGVSFWSGYWRNAPDQIASGPDGNIWFTNTGNGSIGRITPQGVVSNFASTRIREPWGITAGVDGALWFTSQAPSEAIGRITVDGSITTYPISGMVRPGAIATGADGNLWFTTGNGLDPRPAGSETIGQVTLAGAFTYHADPTIAHPNQLAPGPGGMLWFPNSTANTIGRIDTGQSDWGVPSPPSAPTAVVGDGSAVVSWEAPASAGSGPVLGYVVSASTGQTCGWVSGPLECTVTGLTNHTQVTFTVRAVNAVGLGPPSAPSGSVLPHSGALFHPVTPFRLVDSRNGPSHIGPFTTPWGPGETRSVAIGGVNGIPADADAVVLNVTATGGSAASHLRVWPAGRSTPLVSSLNWSAGHTVPNAVTVGLGDAGAVSLFNNSGTADVVIDVAGYYDLASGDGYVPLPPARVSDSRPNGTGSHQTPWGPATARGVPIAGLGGVPAGATAVSLNVTVTSTTTASHLSVWPAGADQPLVSNLNWSAGQTVANMVTVPLGVGGAISVFNNEGNADVIVDVAGYYGPGVGAGFHRVDPVRAVDSRPPGIGTPASPWGPATTRALALAGPASVDGVPLSATAAVVNVTVTNTTGASHLTAWPAGSLAPRSSVINWAPGQTVANGAVLTLGSTGEAWVFNNAATADVIVDVFGWFGA